MKEVVALNLDDIGDALEHIQSLARRITTGAGWDTYTVWVIDPDDWSDYSAKDAFRVFETYKKTEEGVLHARIEFGDTASKAPASSVTLEWLECTRGLDVSHISPEWGFSFPILATDYEWKSPKTIKYEDLSDLLRSFAEQAQQAIDAWKKA